MKRDEAGCNMQPSFTNNCLRAWLVLLAWFSCTAECIIVPSGKVGPITPYRSTPRPTPDPSRIREPAPVVEYSPENPEPPPLDPSYVPQSYKTLSALSGNSIFYIPLKIKNIHEFQGNTFSYISQQNHAPQVPQNDQKFVTWKSTYNSPGPSNDNHQPDVRLPVPVQEVDYSFPKKNRFRQPMKPIIVPPLPPIPQDYYHYNYNKHQTNYNNNYNTNNYKNKYADPLEDKSADNYRYNADNNGQYPKKYNRNTDGSTTKYYYYVKHDYRTDYNTNSNNNNNNNENNNNNSNNNQ